MIQRECRQCGSELVRAKHPDQRPGSIAAPAPIASPGWPYGVCDSKPGTEILTELNPAFPAAGTLSERGITHVALSRLWGR